MIPGLAMFIGTASDDGERLGNTSGDDHPDLVLMLYNRRTTHRAVKHNHSTIPTFEEDRHLLVFQESLDSELVKAAHCFPSLVKIKRRGRVKTCISSSASRELHKENRLFIAFVTNHTVTLCEADFDMPGHLHISPISSFFLRLLK